MSAKTGNALGIPKDMTKKISKGYAHVLVFDSEPKRGEAVLQQFRYRLNRSRSQDFPKSYLFTSLFILKDMRAAAAIVPVAPGASIRQRRQLQ
jgi:hypothetical protein